MLVLTPVLSPELSQAGDHCWWSSSTCSLSTSARSSAHSASGFTSCSGLGPQPVMAGLFPTWYCCSPLAQRVTGGYLDSWSWCLCYPAVRTETDLGGWSGRIAAVVEEVAAVEGRFRSRSKMEGSEGVGGCWARPPHRCWPHKSGCLPPSWPHLGCSGDLLSLSSGRLFSVFLPFHIWSS